LDICAGCVSAGSERVLNDDEASETVMSILRLIEVEQGGRMLRIRSASPQHLVARPWKVSQCPPNRYAIDWRDQKNCLLWRSVDSILNTGVRFVVAVVGSAILGPRKSARS
jgi:hypothetical protein